MSSLAKAGFRVFGRSEAGHYTSIRPGLRKPVSETQARRIMKKDGKRLSVRMKAAAKAKPTGRDTFGMKSIGKKISTKKPLNDGQVRDLQARIREELGRGDFLSKAQRNRLLNLLDRLNQASTSAKRAQSTTFFDPGAGTAKAASEAYKLEMSKWMNRIRASYRNTRAPSGLVQLRRGGV